MIFNRHIASPQIEKAPTSWQWVTCDVGQGDAHLIRTDIHAAYLLDTGDDENALASCLEWAQVETIDALIITHAHSDHYGAYPYVLENYQPQHILLTEQFDPQKAPDLFKRLNPVLLSAGDLEPVDISGKNPDLTGEILGPPHRSGPPVSNQDINNSSLVIHWNIPAVTESTRPLTVLSTGDLESDAAHRLISEQGSSLEAHVLKIPHHGASGSGTDIITATQPRLAVIPVGAGNSYGHPHQAIIDYLSSQQIPTFRTDHSGHIAIHHGPEGISVTTST
ncbi:ComEC/Rec2 family competence protein [Rothia nasimurium]|uniref:ComEC/Rec2 family competence protein n=1 Tax=Rothia nasimurium TaxID=85336 RepID=UPI003B9F1C43